MAAGIALDPEESVFRGARIRGEPEAAVQAIHSPLHDAGIEVHEEIAQRAAEDSQSYPYFVQLWGYHLFDGARARSRRTVDAEVEGAAAAAVAAVRDDYYFERWLELERAPLRWPAVEVARRFGKAEGYVSRDRVRAAIEIGLGRHGQEAGEAAVDGILDLFVDLGYVWERSGRSPGMQAGIPSLMSYVDARAGRWRMRMESESGGTTRFAAPTGPTYRQPPPPLTYTVSAIMNSHRFEHMNRTSSPISSGSPNRFMGMSSRKRRTTSGEVPDAA